jgi:TolB-like protein/Flp pilus assembly protein TadD
MRRPPAACQGVIPPVTEPSQAVFLSYASQDAEAAQKICEALRADGIEVWFDKSELRGGDAWDRQIRKQIHDCALFIPVISANSQARLEGYFRREWKLAADRTHDMAEEKAFLLPVVIDDTSERYASVPDRFRDLQWTHLPAGATTTAFIERLKGLLSRDRARPPDPPSPVPVRAPSHQFQERARKDGPLWRFGLPLIAAVVLLAGIYFLADRFRLSKPGSALKQTTSAPDSIAVGTHSNPEKSIAVLPFVDMSEKHDQEYFADGMAEEVIDELANIPGMKVIGRTSSFQFKGKNTDLRTVGNTLGVKYAVEGSVRKSEDKLRVTAQMVSTADGSHLWSHTYEQPVGDALRIQDQIASSLARALQLTLEADLPDRPTFKSAEAYDLYLRGRHAWDRQDKEGLESAAEYFQQVVQLDTTSATAWAWLAAAQESSAEYGFVEPREGYERARSSVQRARSLDPKSYLPYLVMTGIDLTYDWNWAAAERDANEALRLKPRDPYAVGNLAVVDATLGRWDESTRLFEMAISLDPLFAASHELFSNVRWVTGRLKEAETEARKALQISPTYSEGHYGLGELLLTDGKLDAALAEMQQESSDQARNAGLAMTYYAMGRRADSEAALGKLLREHAQDDAAEIADVYAFRGELDQAFTWLDRAYHQKDAGLYLIKQDGILKRLWSDPRYKAFLRKMNLPE